MVLISLSIDFYSVQDFSRRILPFECLQNALEIGVPA